MGKLGIIVAAALLATSATARDYDRDRARAAERQADSLERIERIEKERSRDMDRDRRNAARDARSQRRLDRE